METKHIGGKIVQARKKLSFSQAQLAERLFISPQAVGKWERGESLPDILTLNRLAALLGVDLNYFAENALPAPVETAPVGPVTQSLLEGSKQKNSRDMSGGNWLEADFSGLDLTGTTFQNSNLRQVNFDRADLTDCKLTMLALANAHFDQSILVRTNLSMSELVGTKFTQVALTDVKFVRSDLRKAVFDRCSFTDVDFTKSDLRGLCLDQQSFTGVKFDSAALHKVSFRGATLQNVSFRSPFSITNAYYRSLKSICFEGTRMDKLVYTVLRSMEIDLSKVIVI